MGWFDDQIKLRKNRDYDGYDRTLQRIAGAVTGRKKPASYEDPDVREKGVIEDILRYYQAELRKIPDRLNTLEERLDYALMPSGIFKREVELSKGWHKDGLGLLLGFFENDGRAVALLPGRFFGYRYFDEERNEYIKIGKDNESLFKRRCYAFYRPFSLKKLTLLDLFIYIKSVITSADIGMALIVTLFVTLLGMLTPMLNFFLFDKVVSQNSVSLLAATGVFMFSVSAGSLLLNAARSMISSRINTRMNLCVEAATMMRILSLPASFFKGFSSGELSSRASNVNSLCSTLFSAILNTGLSSVFSLVYISQIFTYAPGLVVKREKIRIII